EGLRRDDEQRFCWIEVASRLYEVCPIYVGDESARQSPIAVVLQCFIGHDGTEVGATNADVDDIANPLARVTFPFTAADAVTKVRHLVEYGVHLRHDVFAVHDDA